MAPKTINLNKAFAMAETIGNFGDIATFSIRSEKMIGVGEGGVVATNHSGLFESVMRLASRAAPFRTKESPNNKSVSDLEFIK